MKRRQAAPGVGTLVGHSKMQSGKGKKGLCVVFCNINESLGALVSAQRFFCRTKHNNGGRWERDPHFLLTVMMLITNNYLQTKTLR